MSVLDISFIKLPNQYDSQRLVLDLEKIRPDEWITHYRSEHYRGNWSAAPLRSVAGHPAIIHATPYNGEGDFYKNTPTMARMIYIPSVIESLSCPINSIRFLKLGAGAEIFEHADELSTTDFREIRLHIPVTTNPNVQFFVNNREIPMRNGELWYANFELAHRVKNNSADDRVHLVIDCVLNTWLESEIFNAANPDNQN